MDSLAILYPDHCQHPSLRRLIIRKINILITKMKTMTLCVKVMAGQVICTFLASVSSSAKWAQQGYHHLWFPRPEVPQLWQCSASVQPPSTPLCFCGRDQGATLLLTLHEFIVSSKSAFFSFIGTSAISFPINSPD